MNTEHLHKGLASLPVHLRYFDTIGSTNDEAIQWSSSGAEEYSLVVANQQTTGRGRLQRKWVTKPGGALAFSLILHPSRDELQSITLFSPLAAMALCQTLSGYPGLQAKCQIKWPNDVVLNNRKTAGILVESSWLGEEVQSVVIGMGVNVKQDSVPQDNDLLFPATSVEEHAALPVDRIELLRKIIENMITLRADLLQPRFIEKYNDLLAFKDQMVSILQEKQTAQTGKVLGVQSDGNLVIKTEQGTHVSVGVGDVHLRPVGKP